MTYRELAGKSIWKMRLCEGYMSDSLTVWTIIFMYAVLVNGTKVLGACRSVIAVRRQGTW